MIQVKVTHLGAVQFEVNARQHRVFCDQPNEESGYDEGMTPPELFLASLGTCAGYYAAQYLNARGLPTKGLAVRVTAEKAKAPARLDDLHIILDCPPGLRADHSEGLKRAVDKCLILNTLMNPPRVTTEISEDERASKAA